MTFSFFITAKLIIDAYLQLFNEHSTNLYLCAPGIVRLYYWLGSYLLIFLSTDTS